MSRGPRYCFLCRADHRIACVQIIAAGVCDPVYEVEAERCEFLGVWVLKHQGIEPALSKAPPTVIRDDDGSCRVKVLEDLP